MLTEDGVRFSAGGAADLAQKITATELASLIGVLDDDADQTEDRPVDLVGRPEWDWERYISELRLSQDRVELAQRLANLLGEAMAEKSLPWQFVFRKGYVAFQRSGGYNTVLVDLDFRRFSGSGRCCGPG